MRFYKIPWNMMSAMKPNNYSPSNWLTTINAIAFISMTSFSILQNTIFIRNLSLICGALIGLYFIYKNRNIFTLKNSSPLIAIALLFIWVVVHYFLFSTNTTAQLEEFSSVWKRVALSFIFAIGLGLSMRDADNRNKFLVILGFGGSVLIFYVKGAVAFLGIAPDVLFF